MDRRKFLGQSAFYILLLAKPWSGSYKPQVLEIEKDAPTPEPIPEPHFPDRLHLFVWRNWELIETDRMARILGTTPEKVLEIGVSMGLPKKPDLSEDQLRRMYITVMRQNWHLLPIEQLAELLGWDPEHFEYILKEDDSPWYKFGSLKPRCERLPYEEPSAEARKRAAEIKRIVGEKFGPTIDEAGEPAFEFVADLSRKQSPLPGKPLTLPGPRQVDLSRGWTLRRTGENSDVPARLMEEFKAYLHGGFGCEVSLAESPGSGSKVIHASVDRSIADSAGSFEVNVQPEEVRIVGRDLAGIRHALFYLQDQMEEQEGPYLAYGAVHRTTRFGLRYVYPYFALYGDPLMEEGVDPCPDGFLANLSRAGVNGVWLQAVLRNLAPSKIFTEFGAGWETRLRNLNRLVERGKLYGIKVYLYLNEPRSMPAEFFAGRPEIKGTFDPDGQNFFGMCTSTAAVREWLSDSLAHLFSRVSGLGGIFCITASENQTNCYSRGNAKFCPRCAKRPGADVIAEVIQTFRDGVRRGSTEADILAWDWGWGNDWVPNSPEPEDIIRKLPGDVSVLSASEFDLAINRGGIPTKVFEYSISAVGPGPRATRNWLLAQQRGLATTAKVQWSNTWEIAAVPYIPVPNLIAKHCENLLKARIDGLMASWTLGGYPSPNFEVAAKYYFSPQPETDEALRQVAVRRYGKEAASEILEVWKVFSEAFEEYPMEGGGVVYDIPTQHGPANPLRLHPTGYKAGMVLFPYDDYKAWTGKYPVEVVEKQFEKMAKMWEPGLESFRHALTLVPAHKHETARKDLGIAETCYSHFRSTRNQIRFYRLRDSLELAGPEDRVEAVAEMANIAEEEIHLAQRQYPIARQDSTIAYEASNHYFYRPLDLVEKVLNCQTVLEKLKELQTAFQPGGEEASRQVDEYRPGRPLLL